ncbi:MAG: hypothetical protein ACRDBG_27425 [Waterburya sp.]
MSESIQNEEAVPQLADVTNVTQKSVQVSVYTVALKEWTNKELAVYQSLVEETSLSKNSLSLVTDIQEIQNTLGPIQDRMSSAKRKVESLTLVFTALHVKVADARVSDETISKFLETSELLDKAESELRQAQSELLLKTESFGGILSKSADAEDSSRKIALMMCYYLAGKDLANKALVDDFVGSCTASDEERALSVVDRGKGSRRRLMEDMIAQAMDKIRERFGTTTFTM